jgi:prepilin-type N-terminal cleavage/methylation domain-containing protein
MRQKIKISVRKGFTLIEMLIGIAIFVIFLGIVSTSYVSIVRGQREANDIRKMYSEVRDFVDFFSQEVRLGSIDYGSYTVTPGVQSCGKTANNITDIFNQTPSAYQLVNGTATDLIVIRKDGLLKTIFSYDKKNKKIQVLQYVKNGGAWVVSPEYPGGLPKNIMGDTVQVESLKFIINPDVDPYSEDYYCLNQKQFQPQVTLVMSVRNGANINSAFSLDYQTTVSSRVYSRL